jgi:hypothetical protein
VNALFAAAAEVQAFFTARGWASAIIGGLAVQRWGEPRQTRDVDLTLLARLGGEEQFVDPILRQYHARIAEARRFALERRVVLIETLSGIPVDISLGALPYEARLVGRSTPFDVGAHALLVTCSAEDLIVLKAFAGRVQDWLDIEGIIVRQGARLDRALALGELTPLVELKEDTEAEPRLQALFARHPA